MPKKDLASLTTDLGALARGMPTQRPALVAASPAAPAAALAPDPPRAPAQLPPQEAVSQFSMDLRRGLRKQLKALADDADMTMRAFVLNALKEKGLDVHADDLADLRKTAKR